MSITTQLHFFLRYSSRGLLRLDFSPPFLHFLVHAILFRTCHLHTFLASTLLRFFFSCSDQYVLLVIFFIFPSLRTLPIDLTIEWYCRRSRRFESTMDY